ncbi:hypothetical protein MINTMi27_14750 [Mycobacterium intracellulare]|uniref:RusA family crossover junction endodeoxyribonuclease n=1 Tax=Mycobacterium intracellulare TaxID=1767 RepID=UPI00192559C5|nr:RusA family crossover junction endodeoxyribonuclease [Mycobacterium intracellulare]BCP41382.1 hypothetical protein MINTMi27_14750 [Mycobacterium intracellulare]
MISFFVPGKPAPQGSKRHVGRGILIESSKEVGPWRERVALVAHGTMAAERDICGQGLIEKPQQVELNLWFVLPRPASAPKTKTPPATKRPDIDKLARAVLDALTDVVFQDDSQVTSMALTKRLADPGEQPGVTVQIFPNGRLEG